MPPLVCAPCRLHDARDCRRSTVSLSGKGCLRRHTSVMVCHPQTWSSHKVPDTRLRFETTLLPPHDFPLCDVTESGNIWLDLASACDWQPSR